jgi:aryl-alcohol dehydrogenase
MTQATAALCPGPGKPFEIAEITLDALQPREVLVRIAGVGICHSDLAMRDSDHFAPGVLGHEGAGVIEQVGSSVTDLQRGDHVVLSYGSCRTCHQCTHDHPAYCSQFLQHNVMGARPDGSATITCDGERVAGNFFSQSSFASHAIANVNNTVKVDPDLPLAILGPLGCGLQTGAGAVVNSLRVQADQGIAIFGAGGVGLAAVMAAKAVGANPIIVVDLVPAKLALALELGATHVLKGDDVDVVASIKEIAPNGLDFALECVGLPRLLQQALDVLAPLGVCGLLGVSRPGTTVEIAMSALLSGRTEKASSKEMPIPRHSFRKCFAGIATASSRSNALYGPIRSPRSIRRSRTWNTALQ